MVTASTQSHKTIITLTPNRSATMRQTRLLIYAISGFVLLIAMGWSLVGAYLILPFAGLEVGLLAYFLIRTCRATYEKQVITIDRQRVTIYSGIHSIEHTDTLKRPGTRILITEPEYPGRAADIYLADASVRRQVGQFLNQQERLNARVALKAAGLQEVRGGDLKNPGKAVKRQLPDSFEE